VKIDSQAVNYSVTAAHFTGIGGFSGAVLGCYDWETKAYVRIPVNEQVELVSLIGDITLEKETDDPCARRAGQGGYCRTENPE